MADNKHFKNVYMPAALSLPLALQKEVRGTCRCLIAEQVNVIISISFNLNLVLEIIEISSKIESVGSNQLICILNW